MAITLDTIVNKVFKVVKNGYDNNEVEAFLDEILEEMEKREAETNALKTENEQLKAKVAELEQAAAAAPAPVAAAPVAPAAPVADDRHAAESFELVLSKAKSAYEEIVAEADARADKIIAKANEDAAALRVNAEAQVADITKKLTDLRGQASLYCDSLKRAMEGPSAAIEQLRKLL